MNSFTAHAHLLAARDLILGVLRSHQDQLGHDIAAVLPTLDLEIKDLGETLEHEANVALCKRLGAGFNYQPDDAT